eukprot:GHVT01095442.1.p2 GENE.GHVT01095442.1~~GHVT01095442.1.p2  ORF type:complete len:135 (+),score=15.09 GHVT01095442.1:2187-2591(+)
MVSAKEWDLAEKAAAQGGKKTKRIEGRWGRMKVIARVGGGGREENEKGKEAFGAFLLESFCIEPGGKRKVDCIDIFCFYWSIFCASFISCFSSYLRVARPSLISSVLVFVFLLPLPSTNFSFLLKLRSFVYSNE